jgi:hypothetical protein
MNNGVKTISEFAMSRRGPYATNDESNCHTYSVEKSEETKIAAVPEKSEDEYPEQCDAFD